MPVGVGMDETNSSSSNQQPQSDPNNRCVCESASAWRLTGIVVGRVGGGATESVEGQIDPSGKHVIQAEAEGGAGAGTGTSGGRRR
jgi:hypothetical protein